MAKVTGEDIKKTDVALKDQNTEVSFADDDFFGGDSGLENVNQADITLPRITILQGQSPQVNRRKDEYVEGAEAGMLFNTATGKIFDNTDLVIAAYERRNIEWTPRDKPCPIEGLPKPVGGGLHADYGTDDSILDECVRFEDNGSLWTPRGNELVVTGTYYVIDPATLSRAFIAMGKTNFTSSKKLMAGITDEKIQTKDGIRQAPIFYRAWTIGSMLRERDGNSWFVFSHKPGPRLQDYSHGRDMLKAVRDFREEIMAGAAVVDVAVGETDTDVGGDNGSRM